VAAAKIYTQTHNFDSARLRHLDSMLRTCLLLPVIVVLALFRSLSAQESFPDVKDARDVTITFQHTDPLGGGPSYKLVITGNGLVQYEGVANVAHKGKRTRHISSTDVNKLIEEFRNTDFFGLRNYQSFATDMPVRIITFQVGSIRKEIVDRGYEPHAVNTPSGFSSGAPESLIRLEKKVVEIAGIQKWVRR
jgi:hypothetical protein